MNNINQKLLDFISASQSAFHTVKTSSEILNKSGFTELKEHEDWSLTSGGKYYVTRNQSSIIAFVIPSCNSSLPYMIAAAHSDSPTFKIKHNPESETAGYVRINVERYGGMLCSTWFDRPLSFAGRVTANVDGKIVSKLVSPDRDLFMIPSVAIHMNRNANEGANYNAATDMQPISGTSASKGELMKLIASECGLDKYSILSTDLYLYPRIEGKVWGIKDEFVSSPRIDDLQCAFGCLMGLIEANAENSIPIVFIADNEEVGSSTKQGANSTFLSDTLNRINTCLNGNAQTLMKNLASSFMVSADNGHAIHPNHPEYSDSSNYPKINGGIVIKHAASQSYTTDAVSAAIFESICKKAGVPTQHFANRSDMRGGSTLGNISNTQVSMNTLDIGMAQLAMHSCHETAGALDTEYLISAMKEFFSSSVKALNDGEYVVK